MHSPSMPTLLQNRIPRVRTDFVGAVRDGVYLGANSPIAVGRPACVGSCIKLHGTMIAVRSPPSTHATACCWSISRLILDLLDACLFMLLKTFDFQSYSTSVRLHSFEGLEALRFGGFKASRLSGFDALRL